MAELITPENPAITVASVTNPDLQAAFIEAHNLYMANPHLRGIILHRPDEERLAAPADLDWTKDGMRVFEMAAFSYENDTIRGQQATFLATPDFAKNVGTEHSLDRFGGFSDDIRITVLPENLDTLRRERAEALTGMFDFVRGSITFEAANTFRPHFDGGTTSMAYHDEERLFGGRAVRYLEVRNGPGTLIMDSPDSYTTEEMLGTTVLTSADQSRARQMRQGDILLFFHDLWGSERSLPHSSPDFEVGDGNHRMVDNMTIGAGRRVADLRAAMG